MGASTLESGQQRLEQLDEEVEALKQTLDDATASFGDALEEIGSRPDLDGSLQKRLSEVAERLKGLQPEIKDLGFDTEQLAGLYASILEVDRAVHGDAEGLDRFEQILIGVERVRQIIRDALDEYVGGGEPDRQDLMASLHEHLPSATQGELAELLGVDPRTVRRWAAGPGEPTPRLLLVAKLVRILHHAWTPAGITAWFHRPREGLGGRTPLDALSDPALERELMAEARGSRSQYAT